MAEATQLLRAHTLRTTQSRQDILQVFISQDRALSESEVEQAMAQSCDRVTVYRTLGTFLKKGLLHKVLDDSGVTKYALCADDCGAKHYHQHNHVHFKCQRCGQTNCLKSVQVQAFQLPDGYQVEEVNVLLQGVCPDCGE